jgi:hypothetical protein
LRELNFSNFPVKTLHAPINSTGLSGRGPQDAISSKSICVCSSSRKSEKFLRCPPVAKDIAVCAIGDDGLSCKDGRLPALTARIHLTTKSLNSHSSVDCGVLSFQNASNRSQTGCSPFFSAYHTRDAHTAPPDVPLRLTISKSFWMFASNRACRTPAVNAVWLPPPWQAMAILGFISRPPTRRLDALLANCSRLLWHGASRESPP